MRYLIASIVLTMILPFVAFAQSADSQLREQVMSALLADPRAAQMAPAELNKLVDVIISRMASSTNVSASGIRWANDDDVVAMPLSSDETIKCDPYNVPCLLGEAFGFVNSNVITFVPIVLLIISGLGYWVVRRLHHHHVENV